MSRLKFCMLSTQIGGATKQGITKEEMGASQFHWVRIFGGDIVTMNPQFDPEKYDIIYIDAYTLNLPLISNMREKIGYGSSTKIVADIDWGQDFWWKQYIYPYMFKREVNAADILFHVSHYYCDNMERFLQRKVHYNPHPLDYKVFDYNFKKPFERKNAMVIMGHHYENGKYYLPFYATWDLPITRNYNNHIEVEGTAACALYDMVTSNMPFENWIKHLRIAKLAMETYVTPCASRAVYEAAALGVPVVGSKYVEDLAFCFPDLACEPNDMKEMNLKIKRLISDGKHWAEVMEKGRLNAHFYDYENSKQRFIQMLEEK